MRSHLRAVAYAGLTALGIILLYSALARPPIHFSQLGYALELSGDTGLHLNADGTIDYYKADSYKMFKFALPVFFIVTSIGLGLVAKGGNELWAYVSQVKNKSTSTRDSNVN